MSRIMMLIFIALFPGLISSCRSSDHKKVCLRDICVDSEIADTDEERTRGLMYRDGLKEGKAMLFVFDRPSVYSFWMKNMRFSLDIIWIGADLKIVDIKANVLPCVGDVCENLVPARSAGFVLEVPAGFTGKYGIKVGDPVTIK